MPRIVRDPAIQGGEAVIAGTRIPVDVIRGLQDAGWTIEEILAELPTLTADDIA